MYSQAFRKDWGGGDFCSSAVENNNSNQRLYDIGSILFKIIGELQLLGLASFGPHSSVVSTTIYLF